MTDVFDVDAYLDEADLSPLPVTIKGKRYELPHISSLSLNQTMMVDEGNVKGLLVEIAGEDTAEVLANLPGTALNAIIEKWQAQAESEPGEDVASSGS